MRKLAIAILFFCSIHTIQAQFLKFGIKGGVNFSNYSGGNLEGFDFNTVTNYHAGVVSEINLFSNFSIQPELLYSTKGSEIKGVGQEIKDELGYVSIPVLAKFYLTDNQLSLEAGPQFSFLVSERKDFDLDNNNSFDFAIVAGLGFKFTENFFIQGRYGLGLTDVKRDSDVKNSVIQISVGYLF